MITCIDCGKEVERTGRHQKRCADCAKEMARMHKRKYTAENRQLERERGAKYRSENRQLERERHAKYAARRRAERGELEVTCVDCGLKVKRTGTRQRRCFDCAQKSKVANKSHWYTKNRQHVREYNARYNAENPQKIQALYLSRAASKRREAREYMRTWRRESSGLRRGQLDRAKDRDAAIDASRSKRPWTSAEDAVVMSWAEGLRELGAVLGRTRSSVTARRQKLRKRAAEQAASNKEVKP